MTAPIVSFGRPPKTQTVRLLDVFVIGPVMLWAGAQRGKLSDPMKFALIAIGIGTIVFNGANWLAIDRGIEARASEGP